MIITKSNFKGILIFEPKLFSDDRGYLFESYRLDFFNKHIPNIRFIQENQSCSRYGVLRGLHFQKKPYEQSKLIRVLDGKIQDVVVDLRKDSKTYKQYFSIILSSENQKQLFIPKGFAHGFLTLSKKAVISYKMDEYYNSNYDSGIKYNDEEIGVQWDLDREKIILSDKDINL